MSCEEDFYQVSLNLTSIFKCVAVCVHSYDSEEQKKYKIKLKKHTTSPLT